LEKENHLILHICSMLCVMQDQAEKLKEILLAGNLRDRLSVQMHGKHNKVIEKPTVKILFGLASVDL